MLGLDYEVQYKKGTDNRVAYALYRRVEEESSVNAMTTVEPTWIQKILHSYDPDPTATQLLTKLISDPMGNPNYTLYQGIIRYDHKIFLGRGVCLSAKIFEALHQSQLGGHSG